MEKPFNNFFFIWKNCLIDMNKNFYFSIFLLIISIYIPIALAAGRDPLQIEHNMCRHMFADRFVTIQSQDRRARLEAFNVILIIT